ncbi:MAG: Asd/ArgC dimerization domain-containing protein [Gemmatimonadaceae bacterium]
MHKLPVGVLGASGYAGRELCALIARHPGLELRFATANDRRGEHARLGGRNVRFIAHDDAELEQCALVFSALPHGASAPWVERILAAGAKAVDLSADLRPGRATVEPTAGPATTTSERARGSYLAAAAAPAVQTARSAHAKTYPYGLTELFRPEIAGADAVANPGCYPTAILLALAPLAERKLIAADGLVSVSAASGVTGAGSAPRADLLFGELTEDFRPYSPGNEHRHLPEMTATLAKWGAACDLLFAPHLLPVARGILATITVPMAAPLESPNILWRERYEGEPFIEISDALPTLRDVVRRNVVQICATTAANVRTPTLVVFAAIDNLVKGAAGQGLQNANLMLGLPEQDGLPT